MEKVTMKGHGEGAGGDEYAVLELYCILWIIGVH